MKWVLPKIVSTFVLALALGPLAVLVAAPSDARSTQYSRCLSKLQESELPTTGLEPILSDVRRVGFPKGKRWNINGTYDENAVNFLIPRVGAKAWTDRKLLQACLNVAAPPRCTAFAGESSVICNPAFGAQAFAPETGSSAFNVQTILAARFIVTTILAHEIGHLLEDGGDNVARHFYDFESSDGLKCHRRDRSAKSAEERADDYGLALACRAVRASDLIRALPSTPGDMVGTVSSVLRKMDFSYYDIDDLCVGDHNYPSISRRKHTFALRYAECAYPGITTARILPAIEASLFERLETWLRERQITGHPATGEFGSKPLYDHVVVPVAPDALLTIDRTGASEVSIWRTTLGGGGKLAFEKIWHRARDAAILKVVSKVPEPIIDVALRSESEGTMASLEILTVSCAPRGSCAVTERAWAFEESQKLYVSADGSAILSSPGNAVHIPDIRAMSGPAGLSPLPAGPIGDDPIAISGRRAAALLVRSGPERKHSVVVLAPDKLRTRRLDLGLLGDTEITGGSYSGDRLLLLLTLTSARSPLKDGSGLLDCPADMLSGEAGEVRCHLFLPPMTDLGPVQMATRDLSGASVEVVEKIQGCPGMVSIRGSGLLWILDRGRGVADLVPANGLVDCSESQARLYRARRVDTVRLQFREIAKHEVTVRLLQ